jgi:hypothetical protein
MSTVTLIPVVVADGPLTGGPPPGLLNAIAIAVAIMLIGVALKAVKPVVVTTFELVRTLFSTVGIAVLLVLALILLIAALVISAAGQ